MTEVDEVGAHYKLLGPLPLQHASAGMELQKLAVVGVCDCSGGLGFLSG